MSVGKFFLHFFHEASATQTIGSEFGFDPTAKTVDARFGFQHVFSPDLTGKFKVSHQGHADALLKFRLSDQVSAAVSTNTNLRGYTEGKNTALPVGLSFDLKL